MHKRCTKLLVTGSGWMKPETQKGLWVPGVTKVINQNTDMLLPEFVVINDEE